MSLRTNLIQNATAYNNTLTDEFFEGKTNRQLLPFTHPTDRDSLLKAVNKSEGVE